MKSSDALRLSDNPKLITTPRGVSSGNIVSADEKALPERCRRTGGAERGGECPHGFSHR
jgi:hypothetical protein